MSERDPRQEFLNTLLTTPHRDLKTIHEVHDTNIRQDPRFYVHLAAWYAKEGKVRDHMEMFVTMLCLSDFEGHRDVGLALLRRLPPYQVARIVDFIKGRTETRRRRVRRPAARREQRPPQSLADRILGRNRAPEPPAEPEPAQEPEFVIERERIGLFQNVPRSMRTEIQRYLSEREADPKWFDRTVMTARKPMKRLYAGLHIQPSLRAQRILFENDPPAGSLPFMVKQIAKAETPYRVASSVIKEMTPMVLAALIDVMTPQEVINNLASLKRRGVMENREIKDLVEEKLKAAQTDKRVSAYKAKVAIEAAGATGDLADSLDEITEQQIKASGRITRPTALLIDKSGSMHVAIDVGKQLGALISAICDADLFTCAFDSISYHIKPRGSSLADWEKALAGITAAGNTSCGISIEYLQKKKYFVEQIVMVTDEGENTPPSFYSAYTDYAQKMGIRPAVILVRVGSAVDYIQQACRRLDISPNVFAFRGDYYALPNVIPFLTYPSLAQMVMEIMEFSLPERQTA